MKIDEAIKHAREVAEENRENAMNIENNFYIPLSIDKDKLVDGCRDCAEEHEQLAEWLEELKDYRDKNKMVVHVDVENIDILKEKLEEIEKVTYNKGIDDGYSKALKEVNNILNNLSI